MEKIGDKYHVIKATENEYTVVKKATDSKKKNTVLAEYSNKIEAMRNAVNLAKESPEEIEVIIRSDIP